MIAVLKTVDAQSERTIVASLTNRKTESAQVFFFFFNNFGFVVSVLNPCC